MNAKNPAGFRRLPHVLCVDAGNSDRSQMAEGYLRALGGEFLEVNSAGLRSEPLGRLVVQVMQEDGVDIRRQREKLVSRQLLLWADIIITIGSTLETVHPPVPTSAVEKRWTIAPPQHDADREQALKSFRQTRDDVKRRVQQFVNALKLSRRTSA